MVIDKFSILPESGLVLMMCGIAGSGKTTLAKSLEKEGFHLLSIDEEIWRSFGKFGVDYPESEYSNYQKRAKKILEEKLIVKLKKQLPIVLDLSFWSKSERDRVKKLIARYDGRHQIIYLKTSPELLRQRLKIRNQRFDANAAFAITDEILNKFLESFEEPIDENELILESN